MVGIDLVALVSDLLASIDGILSRFGLTLVPFLAINALATTALLVAKTIQELLGHRTRRFSMYKRSGIFYGVLGDIASFYPLMLLLNFLAAWVLPMIQDELGIDFVWSYIASVLIASFIGLQLDMTACSKDRWYLGDYPVPMVYFNWLMDFWADGAVLLFFLGVDWVLFNVAMVIVFVGLTVLSLVFKKTSVDSLVRKAYSCPTRDW